MTERNTLHAAVRRDLESGRPEAAFDRCVQAGQSPRLRERTYALDLLRSVAGRVPLAAQTRARTHALDRARLAWPVAPDSHGAVAFPTVGSSDSNCACFVTARVRPSETVDDVVPDGISADTAQAVRCALDAARGLLQSSDRFSVSFAGPAGWTGPSAGLAVGLAAVSAARGLQSPAFVVASGRVEPDGRVVAVGKIDAKAALLAAARPRAQLLVAVEDDPGTPRCLPMPTLQHAVEHAFNTIAQDPSDVVDKVNQAVRRGSWLEASRLATTVVEHRHLEPVDAVVLLSVRLAAANHAGDAALARQLQPDLDRALGSAGPEDAAVMALGTLAVSAVDRLDASGAHALADRALALRPTDGRHRLHAWGPKALAHLVSGEFEQAVALRQKSLRLAERSAHSDKARCLGDLSAALLRAGHESEALDRALEAIAVATRQRSRMPYRDVTLPFLQYHAACAFAAVGDRAAAQEALRPAIEAPGLAPRLYAQLLAAELDQNRSRVDELWRLLPEQVRATPVVAALFERAAAAIGDGAAAQRLVARFGLPPESVGEAARRVPY